MNEPHTNLQVIGRSRLKPAAGDVFTMRLPDRSYLFGRVVGAELPPHQDPMAGSYLVYVYESRAQSPEPSLDALVPHSLLIPPTFTNRMPWTKGYFRTVASTNLSVHDLLDVHCFWDVLRKRYRDLDGSVLSERTEPCGTWALMSYRRIDDLISDAVGIPRVPMKG